MDNNAAVQLGSYPIYILGASSDPEETQAPSHHASFSMQFPSMRMEPSFPHSKRCILPKNKQPDDKSLILTSPLISWLESPANAVYTVMNNFRAPPYIAQMLQETNPAFVLISEKNCTPRWNSHEIIFTSFPQGLEPCPVAPLALHYCLSAICHALRELYREGIAQNPGRIILLPPSQIRFRDIVMYRFFKFQLAEAGLPNIKACTDNVQRPNSKEFTTEPLYPFCAHCMKTGLTHQRCSGCVVAYYCSVDCQKKGRSKHKTECKERQKEQKDWDTILAMFA